jgi:NADP-dependent 3-hydroxy acid dehydrogenase YdfG
MKLFLAYATDNHAAAQHIIDDLQHSPFEIISFTNKTPNREAIMAEMRDTRDSMMLLLVSENYLKSAECMTGMLALGQIVEPTGRLLAVLTDNVRAEGATTDPTDLRLDLDRSSIVINYQNYWTDAYLALRKEKWNIPAEQMAAYDGQVVIARNISNEIAAFLRLVRNMGYTYQELLAANRYRLLFEKAGLTGDAGTLTVVGNTPEPVAEIESPAAAMETPQVVAEIMTDNEKIDITTPDAEILAAIPGIELVATPIVLPAETVADDAAIIAPVAMEEVPIVAVTDLVAPETETVITTHIPPIAEPVFVPVAEPKIETVATNLPPIQFAPPAVAMPTPVVVVTESVPQDLDKARAALEKRLAAQPNDPATLLEYAKFIHTHDQDTERAKDCLEDAIQQDRKFEAAYLYLGYIVETTDNDPLLAKNYYEKVLTINADNAEAYYRLGSIVHRTFPRQFTIAAEYLKRGLEINPEHPEMNFLYGKLLAQSFKRYTRARRHFKTTIRFAPQHALAYLELAKLYQTEFAEPDRARRYYLAAVQIDSTLHTTDHNTLFDVETDEINALLAPKSKVEKRDTIAFITGATSGIGLATARLLAKQGYRLILNGRRIERLDALKAELQQHFYADILLLPFDVRNAQTVFDSIENLPLAWQNIDVLINNAGLAKGLSPIQEGDINHWNSMIDTNIKGLLFVTRAVSPLMVARGQGHIVNVSSIAGKEVYYRGNVYCATKFAVDALTKGMRIDLHSHGVRVSSVSPGHVEETEFALVRFDGNTEKAAIYNDFQPLTANDVAESILFLLNTPEHVGIHDIQLASKQQAAATIIDRSGRPETIAIDIEQVLEQVAPVG